MNMKCLLLFTVLLLASCASGKPNKPPPPPETFEAMVLRTEYASCETLTNHDYAPAPDCRRLYDAWHRGLKRFKDKFPEKNSDWSMGAIQFYRPRLMQAAEKPYPLIADTPGNPRGISYTSGGVAILYAYEEVVEHEMLHVLTFLSDAFVERTPEMIAADMGGYSPSDFQYVPFYWFWITCHGTPDDPFGEPGNRASCLAPFPAPAGWREEIQAYNP